MRSIAWSLGCLLVTSAAAGQDAPLAVGDRVRVTAGPVVSVPGAVEMERTRVHALRPVRAANDNWVTVVSDRNEPLAVARPGARIEGLIAAADAARLVLRIRSGVEVTVPKAAIRRVEIEGPRRSRGARARRGFQWGAAAAGVAAGVMYATCSDDCAVAVVWAGILAGLVGGPAALITAVASSGETWRAVPATRLP